VTPRGQIGDYTIVGTVGQGGMGAVLRVRHETLGVIRALKVMARPDDPKAQARFERESRNLAGVSHPNLIGIHDACLEPGRAWFAMDLVEGESLKERLGRTGALDWRESVTLMIGISRGVAALHAAGVIHRDLKPSNVMLNEDERPVVIDLGLALAPSTDDRLTRTGAVVGTMRYMPPEVMVGAPPSPTGDVYALGLMLYEMLTGERAIAEQSSWQAQTAAILTESRPAPAGVVSDLPASLDDACVRAMAYASADRFKDAGAFADALEAVLENPGPTRGQPHVGSLGFVAAGAIAAIATGLVAIVLLSPRVPANTTDDLANTPAKTPAKNTAPAAPPKVFSKADKERAAAELKTLRREKDAREQLRLADAWLTRFEELPGTETVQRVRSIARFKAPLRRVRHEGGTMIAVPLQAGRLLTVGRRGEVILWRNGDAPLVRRWTVDCVPFTAAVSPDERYALIGGYEGELVRIDLGGHEIEVVLTISRFPVNRLDFDPSGTRLAVAHDNVIDVLDSSTLNRVLRLPHGSMARITRFSPSGERIASGGGRAFKARGPLVLSTLHLWDAKSGEDLFKHVYSGSVSACAFSPDGSRIAVGTATAQLFVLDSRTGEQLAELKAATSANDTSSMLSGTMAHSYTVSGAAFSANGELLYSCSPRRSGGGELRIWDARTFAELTPKPGYFRPPLEHASKWSGLALTASRDHVILWDRERGGVEEWALPD
jgi:serine/threonine protein kinase